MSLVSLSNSTTTNNNTGTLTTKTTNHQRHSSSTFIAHLLLQEHPPKVQPRSSSARDKALFSHLDRVDAEAGCILIALANHDKRKDMNDLIPYSIRVIDYNQITPIETMESTHGDNNSSINSSNSSTSDSASPHTDNEDPTTTTTTTTTTVKDENDNNTTMSITNLIGKKKEKVNRTKLIVFIFRIYALLD
ncbi:hypothetical protein BC941DRAFT_412097 [Chlamydoabsidia padenii]|nr:hypothetical protein BC941DRAFT_412097 [Chlamydoabsidia padenii]